MKASAPFGIGLFETQDGTTFTGLVTGGEVFELDQLVPGATLGALLGRWREGLVMLSDARARVRAGEGHPLDTLRPLPPVTRASQIFQSGANYRTHVLDLIDAAERRGDNSDGFDAEAREQAREQLDKRAKSGRPFVFSGSVHALAGANDDVILPYDRHQHDWELELAAVIGFPGRRLTRENALDIVAGYTISNDLTTRDALNRPDGASLGLDWLAGKNAPTFLPTGPYIVPAEFVADPQDLRIELKVNGSTMQDGSTADMLFNVAQIIEFVSQVTELRPGDLVLTGSPAGNGASHGVFLKPGDLIEGHITGLGAHRNRCVAEHPGGQEQLVNENAATDPLTTDL